MADNFWNTIYSEDLYYTYTFRGSYTIFDWDQYKFFSADVFTVPVI
jgi:hypothetical protein